MIALEDAASVARQYIERNLEHSGLRLVLQDEHTTEYSFGWLFFYNSEEFVRTGDVNHLLAGNAPLLVEVYELTVEDLQQTAVWEFALDEEGVEGQDEATVRPYESRGPMDMPEGMFIVRARFHFPDGTTASGFLTPPGLDAETFDLGIIQPVVVTRRGQVSFWHGIVTPKPQEIGDSYSRLGKQPHQQVFPIRFESDVSLEKPVSGSIPGFLVLEDWKAGATRTLM